MSENSLPALKARSKNSDLDHVYAELKRSIMMGEFMPGQKLKLADLAAAFGTSHMPVREALNRLVMAGALESSHRRSPSVPAATFERLNNLLALRVDLEGKAVTMAAEASDATLVDQLKQINARMDVEASKGNSGTKAYLRQNHRFHFTLYERCGNPELVDLIELLWMRYGPLLSAFNTGAVTASGHRHHDAIIRAVEKKDGEAARVSLTADLVEAAEVIGSSIASGTFQDRAES